MQEGNFVLLGFEGELVYFLSVAMIFSILCFSGTTLAFSKQVIN